MDSDGEYSPVTRSRDVCCDVTGAAGCVGVCCDVDGSAGDTDSIDE